MFLVEPALFLLSSAVTLALIYFNLPTQNIMQIIGILLVFLLVLTIPQFSRKYTNKKFISVMKLVILFLSALLLQVIITTTGGFYSPFLILLHLFTLTCSLLLNLQGSISFLIFSLALLLLNSFINVRISGLIMQDPWSVVLFSISFIVIIPLIYLLTNTYHLKDALSKLLYETIQVGKEREQSILNGLQELVIITDESLAILYTNGVFEKIYGVSSIDVMGKKLLEVLDIRNNDNLPVSENQLSIADVIQGKNARIVENVNLFNSKSKKKSLVNIQVRPIQDLQGKIRQLVFVISDAPKEGQAETRHANLEKAHQRHHLLLEELKKNSLTFHPQDIQKKIVLLEKMEEDLFAALEVQDHAIKQQVKLADFAQVCKNALASRQDFALALHVILTFNLPKTAVSEMALLNSTDPLLSTNMPASDFAAPMDAKWMQLFLEKLLDISILLTSNQPKPEIQLLLSREPGVLKMSIRTTVGNLTQADLPLMFTDYFGDLEKKTNLQLGSGIEGTIAKILSNELNIPISLTLFENQLIMSFTLSQTPLQ